METEHSPVNASILVQQINIGKQTLLEVVAQTASLAIIEILAAPEIFESGH
jgi:hypothetical protein